MITIPENKPSILEKFGLFYLNLFNKIDNNKTVFNYSDDELTSKVKRITIKGIILSSIVGIVCVFPTIWIDVKYTNSTWKVHYAWVIGVSIIAIAIELYLLFIIALKAVYEVSQLINMHSTQNDFLENGIFSVKHILARTALEVPDPELKILGIDPFKRISKKNLLLLGLLYKAKIVFTNVIIKFLFNITGINFILGIPIVYEALPVECFWNSVVIKKVINETRLRLFGFALANQIATNVVQEKCLEQLSPLAKIGCLRAIGNAVVMAQNYHPNMIILLLRFQQVLKITEENKYDDWNLFLETLQKVTEKERNFLLDLFTVAAAFDGKLSELEKENLNAAYGNDYNLYFPRLNQLTECLKNGKLNKALSLCKLDFIAG